MQWPCLNIESLHNRDEETATLSLAEKFTHMRFISGSLDVRCAASGLTASVSFLPERRVDGSVVRLQGQGTAAVASISGFWDSKVQVDVPEWGAQGVTYSAQKQWKIPSPQWGQFCS